MGGLAAGAKEVSSKAQPAWGLFADGSGACLISASYAAIWLRPAAALLSSSRAIRASATTSLHSLPWRRGTGADG
jgi:hypothetical protein